MKPARVEFTVGQTAHGQRVKLIMEDKGGRQLWTIHKEAANQLDQDDRVFDLPAGVILSMAEAVKTVGESK